MSELMWCPKCGALMNEITIGHICPLCGYRVPAQTITTTTGTSVEYVPVIRCKDCKWHIKGGFCDLYFADRAADEYCSRAERKDE